MKLKKNDLQILAHEIKNPLAVARGYAEMLNTDNIEKYQKIIIDEINNSIKILDSYMEQGKISIKKEEMDINVLLEDLEKSFSLYLERNHVNLKINYLDDEIYLYADYDKLKQVLYNIIKNSVESNSKNILISYEVSKRKIYITIKNDGEKINNNIISQIGNNYSNKILGHGIGTTLSKEIIELHDGSIKYKNNQDGVSVIITLNLSWR